MAAAAPSLRLRRTFLWQARFEQAYHADTPCTPSRADLQRRAVLSSRGCGKGFWRHGHVIDCGGAHSGVLNPLSRKCRRQNGDLAALRLRDLKAVVRVQREVARASLGRPKGQDCEETSLEQAEEPLKVLELENFCNSTLPSPTKKCATCQCVKLVIDFESFRKVPGLRKESCRACVSTARAKRAKVELRHLAMTPETAWENAKACLKCGCIKELRDFGNNASTKDGLSAWCRACTSMDDQQKRKEPLNDTPQECRICKQMKQADEFGPRARACKTCLNVRRQELRKRHRSSGLFIERVVKICVMCQITKPVSEFNKSKECLDNLDRTCRTCRNTYGREWYKRHTRATRERLAEDS